MTVFNRYLFLLINILGGLIHLLFFQKKGSQIVALLSVNIRNARLYPNVKLSIVTLYLEDSKLASPSFSSPNVVVSPLKFLTTYVLLTLLLCAFSNPTFSFYPYMAYFSGAI